MRISNRTVLFAALSGAALLSVPAYALGVGVGGGATGGAGGVGGVGVGAGAHVGTPSIGTSTEVGTPAGRAGTNAWVPSTDTDASVNTRASAEELRRRNDRVQGDVSVDDSANASARTRHHGRAIRDDFGSRASANTRTDLDAGRTGAMATGSANITAHNPGGSPSLETGTQTNAVVGR